MHVTPRWVKQQFGKIYEALIKLSYASTEVRIHAVFT